MGSMVQLTVSQSYIFFSFRGADACELAKLTYQQLCVSHLGMWYWFNKNNNNNKYNAYKIFWATQHAFAPLKIGKQT